MEEPANDTTWQYTLLQRGCQGTGATTSGASRRPGLCHQSRRPHCSLPSRRPRQRRPHRLSLGPGTQTKTIGTRGQYARKIVERKKPACAGGWSGNVLFSQGAAPQVSSRAERLNCRVRDGNGCFPFAIVTTPPACTGGFLSSKWLFYNAVVTISTICASIAVSSKLAVSSKRINYDIWLVETRGFEPLTSAVQRRRSSN